MCIRGQKRALDSMELVTDGCELPCTRWELNLGLLQEQQVFLTTELQGFLIFRKCNKRFQIFYGNLVFSLELGLKMAQWFDSPENYIVKETRLLQVVF